VIRRLIEWPERGVGAVSRITQAIVVCRLAAAEVRIEALGRKTVEALDRLLQRVSRDLHVAREISDGLTSQDRAPLDQFFGEAAFLERVCSRDVSMYVALVKDHPARHCLIGVHRLAHFDVLVRLVAEPSAGAVDVNGPGSLPPA